MAYRMAEFGLERLVERRLRGGGYGGSHLRLFVAVWALESEIWVFSWE